MKAPIQITFMLDATTYYAVVNNKVVPSSEPYDLKHCIENWPEVGYEDNRNMRFGSLYFTSSIEQYSFVKEAALILRHHHYNYGTGKKLIVAIRELNKTTQEYEPPVLSNVDFTTMVDEKLRVSVNLFEDSVVTKIKNSEDIEYSIPVTGSMVKTIRIAEQHAPGRIRFISAWPKQGAAPGTVSETIIAQTRMYQVYVDKSSAAVNVPTEYMAITQSGTDANKFTEGQIMQAFDNSFPGLSAKNYLFEARVALSSVQVSGTFDFGVSNGGNAATFRLQVWITDSSGGKVALKGQSTKAIAANANVNFTQVLNVGPFNMTAGHRLVLEVWVDDGTGSLNYPVDIAWGNGQVLTVTFINATQSFTVKGLSVYEVAKQLTSKISDGKATFKSNLLSVVKAYSAFYDLDPSKLMLLSENSIIGYEDAAIKLSLKTLMDALSVLMGAGTEVNTEDPANQYVSIEERHTYFDTGILIADLGEVSSCKVLQANDSVFNSLKIGYKLDEYTGTGNAQDNTGRYEYNTLYEYKLPADGENKPLEMISRIRADGLGMYNVWADYNFRDKDRNTRSSSYGNMGDAKLFFLQITGTKNGSNEDVAAFAHDLRPSATITGLIDRTDMINPGLTPARCLLRNGRWLNSLFFGQDADKITWLSSELNANLISNLFSGTITEKADVTLGNLASRVYYPKEVEIKTTGIKGYYNTMKGKRKGFIRFSYLGIVYEAFPIKMMTKLAKGDEYTFRLRIAPSFNMKSAIR